MAAGRYVEDTTFFDAMKERRKAESSRRYWPNELSTAWSVSSMKRYKRRYTGGERRVHWRARLGGLPEGNLIRYADDFVITGASRDVLENEVIPMVRGFLAQRGLSSPRKRQLSRNGRSFDFLGLNIRRYGDTLLTKPSQKSVKRLLDRIRGIVKSGRIKGGNATID